MKAFIVELPLRTIHLHLQDKAQTGIESRGLLAYEKLHSHLWDIRVHWQQSIEKLDQVKSMIKELNASFNALEVEVMKYGPIAGFSIKETSKLFSTESEFELNHDYLQDIVNAFSTLNNRFNQQNRCLQNMYEAGEKMRERFSLSLRHFNQHYFSPIVNAYDSVQVDTVSLDRDFDQFRSACGDTDNLHDAFVDEWNLLAEEQDLLDTRVKRIDMHLKCLSQTLDAIQAGAEKSALN